MRKLNKNSKLKYSNRFKNNLYGVDENNNINTELSMDIFPNESFNKLSRNHNSTEDNLRNNSKVSPKNQKK